MNIYRVNDLSADVVLGETYDLGIFASGYEERCTFLSEQVQQRNIRRPILLGFSGLADSEPRKAHDKYLSSRWQTEPIITSGEDEGPIYNILRELSAKTEVAHILVDYSSMSRLWYAGILNWARYGNGPAEVVIDFVYSIGKYEINNAPMVIQDMLAVPGCEGGALRLEESVAVFGLGFNGWASLCVLERLEADRVYAYLADPAASSDYPERVREKNGDFLEEPRVNKQLLEFPLRSVETSYRYLSELISPHRANDIITLVPMGPKPHVLASMLVSMRFPEVSCLRVNAHRPMPEKVQPTGELSAVRVVVRNEADKI